MKFECHDIHCQRFDVKKEDTTKDGWGQMRLRLVHHCGLFLLLLRFHFCTKLESKRKSAIPRRTLGVTFIDISFPVITTFLFSLIFVSTNEYFWKRCGGTKGTKRVEGKENISGNQPWWNNASEVRREEGRERGEEGWEEGPLWRP